MLLKIPENRLVSFLHAKVHKKLQHSNALLVLGHVEKNQSSNPDSRNINFRIVVESFMRIVMVLLNEDISADDHKKLCEVTKTDVGEDTWGAIVNFF